MQTNEQNVSNRNRAPASFAETAEEPAYLAAHSRSLLIRSLRKRLRDDSSESEEDGSEATTRRRLRVQDHLQGEPASAGSSTPSTPNATAQSDDPVIDTAPEAILLGPATGFERSILRRLPMELRLHIYSLALAADDMAHSMIHKGITCPKPPEVLVFSTQYQYRRIPPHFRHDYHFEDVVVSISSRRSKSKRAALLRTCRQVYAETLDLLYEQRTFVMNARSFTALAAMVPQHSLDRIRHIQFTLKAEARADSPYSCCEARVLFQWITFWPIVANMKNLQTLSVNIRDLVGSTVEIADDHRSRPVLEPLLALHGLERFDLQYQAEYLPYPGSSISFGFNIPVPGQTLALIEEIKEAATRPRFEPAESA
ncbi:MAG: hypothetical protein LQ339_000671 [Xanthoria mediterranea]|nr:MAG: hypothetical protein LQ339_000671 [Xanthoria mediterranea]